MANIRLMERAAFVSARRKGGRERKKRGMEDGSERWGERDREKGRSGLGGMWSYSDRRAIDKRERNDWDINSRSSTTFLQLIFLIHLHLHLPFSKIERMNNKRNTRLGYPKIDPIFFPSPIFLRSRNKNFEKNQKKNRERDGRIHGSRASSNEGWERGEMGRERGDGDRNDSILDLIFIQGIPRRQEFRAIKHSLSFVRGCRA